MSPPRVLTILEDRQVCVTRPDEPISTVLGRVVRFDYSQVPVYGDTGHVSLLRAGRFRRASRAVTRFDRCA
jgi:predicted transcriptional regulator